MTAGAVTSEINNLSSAVQDDEKKGMSVVRLLVRIAIQAATFNVNGELFLGIYMVEDDASAAAAFADPNAEGQATDWLWRERMLHNRDADAGPQVTTVERDLRSGRRFPARGYDLTLVGFAASASNMVISGQVRVLYMKS